MSIKEIPKFRSQKDERSFWERTDASHYFDLSEARCVKMPNLRPSILLNSERLSEGFIKKIIGIYSKD